MGVAIAAEERMLAAVAMMAISPVTPPITHARSFTCTPSVVNIRTGVVECSEGYSLNLWGIQFRRKGFTPNRAVAVLPSLMNARGARVRVGGSVELEDALPMQCYSEDRGRLRTAQCFVRSALVFGDEDLARRLVRDGFAAPTRAAAAYYPRGLKYR
jgi:hypothetical protein